MALDKESLARLQQLVGGDHSDLADLIEAFLEEAPGLIQAMQEAVRIGDKATIRRAAHSLKSNARDMGAIELADICARIETISAQGGMPPPDDVADAESLLTLATGELELVMRNGS